MSRRKLQLFDSLSFLDIVFSALGAVLFLFIVVDKGGTTEINLAEEEMVKIYMDLDTTSYRFHGNLPDSIKNKLDTLRAGTPVMLVLNGKRPLPGVKIPECVCPECIYPGKGKPQPSQPSPQPPQPPSEKPRPIACDDAACQKTIVNNNNYSGDPIEIPYSIGFAIVDNTNFTNDIDIKVCRDGACAPNGRNNSNAGMRWVDMREKGQGLFGSKKARTGGEMILVEESIIPGDYTISAKFDLSKGAAPASTQITATVATKQNNNIREKRFTASLTGNANWTVIGRVHIDANGNITQLAL